MQNLEKKAIALATKHHFNQFRQSGEPYITHCIETAKILKSWGITDKALIAAAYTHDLLEDTTVTKETITKVLGSEVAKLVDGVTKFKKTTMEQDNFATKQKLASESFLDPRVAILKLADRLHNMTTLSFVDKEKQIIKAKETLSLYAPLAESLGIWQVKHELEDLSFSYLDPENYQKMKQLVTRDPRFSTLFTNVYISKLKRALNEHGLSFKIEIRKNGYWQISKKRDKAAFSHLGTLQSISQINDVISIRVICKSIKDCYLALFAVHKDFSKEIDETRFDEFIVTPRLNGYSALQTTIETKKGSLEIAITTMEKEKFNNWGVVALLETGNKNLASYSQKAVFTLNDTVWYLPKEATVLDVAYKINPELGRSARTALVNGQSKPLKFVVPNAARVIFGVEKGKKLNRVIALHSVSLPYSKSKVREEIAQKEWERRFSKGKLKVAKMLNKENRGVFDLSQIHRNTLLSLFLANGCKNLSEFYYKVGLHKVALSEIAQYLNNCGYEKNNKNQRGLLVLGDKKHDKPGVLAEITNKIAKGKANILYVENISTEVKFQVTLIMSSISLSEALKLKKNLEKDQRFTKVCVV